MQDGVLVSEQPAVLSSCSHAGVHVFFVAVVCFLTPLDVGWCFHGFRLKQIGPLSFPRVCLPPPKKAWEVCAGDADSAAVIFSADELPLCSILISSTGPFNSSPIQTAVVIPTPEVTAAGASLAVI